MAKPPSREWSAGDHRYVVVEADDKGANDKLKKEGAVLFCSYFSCKGIKFLNQYSIKKVK